MHSEHDAITLGAALLLWFVGLVAIGIAVLARMGRTLGCGADLMVVGDHRVAVIGERCTPEWA
jgi:hypothetical protein